MNKKSKLSMSDKSWSFALLMLFCFIGGAHLQATENQNYASWTAWLNSHDPVVEATKNFEKGDIHVISAMGVGHYYPGIDGDTGYQLEKKYATKYLPDMSDAIRSDKHMDYMTVAGKYASAYNLATVKLLKDKGAP